jgi:hypothetical protein
MLKGGGRNEYKGELGNDYEAVVVVVYLLLRTIFPPKVMSKIQNLIKVHLWVKCFLCFGCFWDKQIERDA